MKSSPRSAAASAPLQRAVDSGLLHTAVPVGLGGSGGEPGDLVSGFSTFLARDPEGAMALRQQRIGIEFLMHSRNAALRDLLLPDFLHGARAATVALGALPLDAQDLGSAWLLNGSIERVSNLAWEGFSLLARAQLQPDRPAWVLLRSEEDGLDRIGSHADHTAATALRLRDVYFRMDEWLGGDELTSRVQPVLDALTPPQVLRPTKGLAQRGGK
jgi:alkylation response protein AidB-like acyl-CoA dehydrogenase